MSEQRRNTRNIGSYIIGNTLGEGAFGKVKLGTHIHTGEKVAIKILDKKKMQEDPDDISRVQSEIAILKKMKHKNIIQLYEIMESTRNIYLIVEYCEEKELFDYINDKGRLSEAEALKFFQELIDALDYLHCQNIVHRDLKPENLLLDYKFSIKLSDFGLSRTYTNDKLLSTPCGTPSYAPPEMLNGEEYHGLLSDIWSSGVILYAMLSGFLPFDESNEEINCQKIIQGDYQLPDWISECAGDLIKKILVTDPYYRFDLEQIKSHPWFNSNVPCLRPGIIVGYHRIPIDEKILQKVEYYGFNIIKTRENLLANKFCVMTAIYHLILRKYIKEGRESVSDLESEEYLRYISDENNVIEVPNEENENIINKLDEDIKAEEEEKEKKKMNENNQNVNIKDSIAESNAIQSTERNPSMIKNLAQDTNHEDNFVKNRINKNGDDITSSGQKNRESLNSINLENNQRKMSSNTYQIEDISFKNFENVVKNTRNRYGSVITNPQNYAKRFLNKKSIFLHQDLGAIFANRARRYSEISPSLNLQYIPKLSVVLDNFRRNSCKHGTSKIDEEKILALFNIKLSDTPSLKNNLEDLVNLKSINENSLRNSLHDYGSEVNPFVYGFHSSDKNDNEKSEDPISSLSNIEDESVETVNSRKKSIINNHIKIQTFLNSKSPVKKIETYQAEKKTITDSKKVKTIKMNQTGNALNSLNVSNFHKCKVPFEPISKFVLKSDSKSKYNVENLRPKVIHRRDKIQTQLNQASNKISTKIKQKNSSASCKIMKNDKKENKEKTKIFSEVGNLTFRNKILKDATVVKNDTSVEKSTSKTPCRNLSYSSHYAKKSRKERIEEMPWNIKKKILEVENYSTCNKTNYLDSIKGIVDRYEKFKKKNFILKSTKNPKNISKVKKAIKMQVKNENKEKVENQITIQDINSCPKEINDLESENSNHHDVDFDENVNGGHLEEPKLNDKCSEIYEEKLSRDSKGEKTNSISFSNDYKEEFYEYKSPNKVKKFVCFETNSSKHKTHKEDSNKNKTSINNSISSLKNKYKTEKKSNIKINQFKENFLPQSSVFYTSNHIKDMFYKNAQLTFEMKYKKAHMNALNFNLEKCTTLNHETQKQNKNNFLNEDINLSHLNIHSGPIDLSTIIYSDNVNRLIEEMIEVLNRRKIRFIRTKPYKFKCSKNGISFELQLLKLDNIDDSYAFGYKMFKSDSVGFRRLCQDIIAELY